MADLWDEKNEVKNPWFKWGKIGDFISGTLVDVREIQSNLPGKEGEKVKVYEVKVERGSFHELDQKKNPVKEATVLEPNEVWLVGGRMGLDAQMRRVKIGQKLGMKFTEEKEATKKGFNPLKIIKVYTTNEMDEAWLSSLEPTAGNL